METLLKPLIAAPLCLAAAVCFIASANAATMSAPDVPAAVAAPAGHSAVMTLKGVGLLTYECRAKAGAMDTYEWVFAGPNATLQDSKGMQVGKYYGGPTWEHTDGSKVTGKQLATAPAGAGAIPLQLVQANATGSGAFSGVTYIQRINTVGGVAPAAPCAAGTVGAKQTVSYAADYVFFKP
jgi:hypothetical protein